MHLHVVKIRLWKATVENDLKCWLKNLYIFIHQFYQITHTFTKATKCDICVTQIFNVIKSLCVRNYYCVLFEK